MEKYFERYENMNPMNIIKLRYKLRLESHYDYNEKEVIKLGVYHNGNLKDYIRTNQGVIYILKENDLIEILIQKNNTLVFRVKDESTNEIKATTDDVGKLDGEFGSGINFYISQNNNSFFREIKYKEEIPKTILPYNPFIDVKQIG